MYTENRRGSLKHQTMFGQMVNIENQPSPSKYKERWFGSPEFCWYTFPPPHRPASHLPLSRDRQATRPSPAPPPPRTRSPPTTTGRLAPLSLTLPWHHYHQITLSRNSIIGGESCLQFMIKHYWALWASGHIHLCPCCSLCLAVSSKQQVGAQFKSPGL